MRNNIVKSDDKFFIFTNSQQSTDKANSFLCRKNNNDAVAGSWREWSGGYSWLGGVDYIHDAQNNRKWKAGIMLTHDNENDCEYKTIGCFETRTMAINALWDERRRSRINTLGVMND